MIRLDATSTSDRSVRCLTTGISGDANRNDPYSDRRRKVQLVAVRVSAFGDSKGMLCYRPE